MRSSIAVIAFLILTVSCKNKESEYLNSQQKNPLQELQLGNQRFLNEKSIHPRQNKRSVLENQNSQHPLAVVLTCSDSRVSPEILFDQGIGDLFVIRNAGNLISDIDMGSIEYAVNYLDAKLIVVLGHTECGAIKAYIEDKNDDYKQHQNHIHDIIATVAEEEEELEEKKFHPKETNLLGCIDANIAHSVKLIKNNKLVQKNKAKVVSMRYDVHTGKIIQLSH